MADLATGMSMQQATRIRALTFPREHGAWGLLLIPLVTGACVGLPNGHGVANLVLFLTTALTIFWLRTPIESLFGMGIMRIANDEERRAVLRMIGYLAPVLAACLAMLFWGGRNMPLLFLGCIGAAAFAMQSAARLFGRKARLLSLAVGSIGLTSTAAGAYYAVTGYMDQRALAVWFASFLFAGDQLHFVQLRVRNARVVGPWKRMAVAKNFLAAQVLMLLVVALGAKLELLPMYALIAFIPVVIRGCIWVADKHTSVDLPWLGITELIHGITFGALLTAAFLVAR